MHAVHALISILTVGLWLPVWFFVTVESGLAAGLLTPPAVNKTRRRRLVPVGAALRAWLDAWLSLGSPVIPVNFDRRWRRVRQGSGIWPWSQNVLRHSRVSYRLAETGNAAQTADEDGHSEAMLHRNYRALVTPEAAARYFAILPTPGLNLAEISAAGKVRSDVKRTGGPERMRAMARARWANRASNLPAGDGVVRKPKPPKQP